MTIETILSQIELGNYALPEFQRGYVWNRDQVRKLMNSLYRGYPIGGLLTWVTEIGEYRCQGYDTFGPFKLVGGIAKGHPTVDEIQKVVKFYKNLE